MPLPAALVAYKAGRAVHGAWSAAKHPRGEGGRFVPVGKFSFRVSPRSATVQYGHTIPIVPGKANLYIGGLARIERARGHETALETKLRAQGRKLTSKLPAKVQKIASRGGIEGPGGTTFVVSRPRIRQPQLKAMRRVGTKPTRMPVKDGIGVVRAPNRKPRTRSLPKSHAARPALQGSAKTTGKKVNK